MPLGQASEVMGPCMLRWRNKVANSVALLEKPDLGNDDDDLTCAVRKWHHGQLVWVGLSALRK